ncbi:MAG: sigma-54-dependent transcriptional regulator [Alphaproteobacteria bacterium]
MRTVILGQLEGYMTMAAKILLDKGVKISHVETLDLALSTLRSSHGADLLLVDIVEDVPRLMRSLKEERICVPVVACGIGSSQREKIVQAIEEGVKEYLPLPPEPALIAAVLEAVSTQDHQAIFQDPVTKGVFDLAGKFATSDASILITGESGTGKEVMARYIHQKSKRQKKPFVSINCAAIPENLLESELFGHEKGAFTGAIARRLGLFEQAHGGTLLLDEISEMHPRLQAKLLRAVQEREINRVGGGHPVKVDIRLLATSNRDLLKAVEDGSFREDLYFRLNVINLELPPLRKRPGDLAILSNHFLAKYADANGISMKPLSEDAQDAIKAYHWPGNVRELENAMHRAVLLSSHGDEILPEHIFLFKHPEPRSPLMSQGGEPWVGQTISAVEKTLILETLDHCLGNRTHAAHILGITIRTLRNKLKQYGVEHLEEDGEGFGDDEGKIVTLN